MSMSYVPNNNNPQQLQQQIHPQQLQQEEKRTSQPFAKHFVNSKVYEANYEGEVKKNVQLTQFHDRQLSEMKSIYEQQLKDMKAMFTQQYELQVQQYKEWIRDLKEDNRKLSEENRNTHKHHTEQIFSTAQQVYQDNRQDQRDNRQDQQRNMMLLFQQQFLQNTKALDTLHQNSLRLLPAIDVLPVPKKHELIIEEVEKERKEWSAKGPPISKEQIENRVKMLVLVDEQTCKTKTQEWIKTLKKTFPTKTKCLDAIQVVEKQRGVLNTQLLEIKSKLPDTATDEVNILNNKISEVERDLALLTQEKDLLLEIVSTLS